MQSLSQANTNLIVSQGFKDAREWRRFLVSHGKADYKVFADVDDLAACDAMQISPCGRVSYVELKERRVPIDTYPDCAVDYAKIIALQRLAQDTGDKVFLAALYPSSHKIAIWEIHEDEEYFPTTIMANDRTVQLYGPSQKKPKQMVKLPLSKAHIYSHTFEQL